MRGAATLRVEDADQRYWQVTLLEHSAVPGAVGSTWAFDGQRSVYSDPRVKPDVVMPYGPDQVTVPADWLVPRRTPPLAGKPGATRRRLGNGQAVATQVETLPDGRRSRREVTYREADGIPTGLVQTTDGKEVRRVQVTDLQVRTG